MKHGFLATHDCCLSLSLHLVLLHPSFGLGHLTDPVRMITTSPRRCHGYAATRTGKKPRETRYTCNAWLVIVIEIYCTIKLASKGGKPRKKERAAKLFSCPTVFLRGRSQTRLFERERERETKPHDAVRTRERGVVLEQTPHRRSLGM